jgi:hypothetical protein
VLGRRLGGTEGLPLAWTFPVSFVQDRKHSDNALALWSRYSLIKNLMTCVDTKVLYGSFCEQRGFASRATRDRKSVNDVRTCIISEWRDCSRVRRGTYAKTFTLRYWSLPCLA